MRVDYSGAGALAGAMNNQTFGAAVVSKTMDYMNNASGSSALTPSDGKTFGAAVVSKTMDYMNSGNSSQSSKGGMSEMNQTYDFAKDILSAYTQSQGAIVNIVT